jgi:uncharacterized protein
MCKTKEGRAKHARPSFCNGVDMQQPPDSRPTAATVPADNQYPGLLPAIGFIISYFALQGLCTVLIMAATQESVTKPEPINIIFGLILSAAVQLGLMWLYLRKNGRAGALGLHHFGRIALHKATGLAILLVIAAMAFNAAYTSYVIPGIKMQAEMGALLAGISHTPLNILAMFLAIAVAAPLVEELLFRGLLQTALAKYVPVWAAIIVSSLLFALVHGQPYAIPALMSLSIAFGYLYHRTGSLRTNIILHMANNIFALLITQFMV